MVRPKRLSAAFVKTVNAPGAYGDGRGGFGLTLLVKGSSRGVSKSWYQRLRVDGQPFNIGLGGYPRVSLGTAREKALANARGVDQGIDPRVKPTRMPTFSESMERAIEVLRPGWKGPRTEKQMRDLLSQYALPHIGKKRIDAITPADILAFLAPLAVDKVATGAKVKARMSQVFQWAIAQGLRQDNPADRNINQALPKLQTKRHFKALPFCEVSDTLSVIRNSRAWWSTKAAFEFLVLTAARSGEVRLADWSEIDLDAALWTIPGERMKSGRPHRVPLSAPALAVLESARELGDGEGLVFPSITGKAMSDNTLSKILRDARIEANPHGFRSSFRDWCAESNIDRQVAESALAHRVGDDTETAYLRSDVLALRRAAMDAWGEYLIRTGSIP